MPAATTTTKATRRSPKRRSDFGSVQMTERDLVVLRWIGEQYAVRVDHLAVLAGRESDSELQTAEQLARPTVQQLYNRYLKAGWVEKRKLLAADPQWIWLTKAGLKQVGLDYPYRVPSIARLQHIYAVNAVRLAIEAKIGDKTVWVSDRKINQERKERGRQHIVDGEVHYTTKAIRVAIEVEITQKTKKSLQAILAELEGEYQVVWYFLSDQCYNAVSQVIQEQPNHQRTFVVYRLRDYGG